MEANKKNKEGITAGGILIIILLGLNLISILFSFSKNVFQVGPYIFHGGISIIWNLIAFGVTSSLIFGMLKMKKWAVTLGIIWFSLTLIMGSVDFVSFISNPHMFESEFTAEQSEILNGSDIVWKAYQTSLIFSFIVGFAINAIVLGYFIKKKKI